MTVEQKGLDEIFDGSGKLSREELKTLEDLKLNAIDESMKDQLKNTEMRQNLEQELSTYLSRDISDSSKGYVYSLYNSIMEKVGVTPKTREEFDGIAQEKQEIPRTIKISSKVKVAVNGSKDSISEIEDQSKGEGVVAEQIETKIAQGGVKELSVAKEKTAKVGDTQPKAEGIVVDQKKDEEIPRTIKISSKVKVAVNGSKDSISEIEDQSKGEGVVAEQIETKIAQGGAKELSVAKEKTAKVGDTQPKDEVIAEISDEEMNELNADNARAALAKSLGIAYNKETNIYQYRGKQKTADEITSKGALENWKKTEDEIAIAEEKAEKILIAEQNADKMAIDNVSKIDGLSYDTEKNQYHFDGITIERDEFATFDLLSQEVDRLKKNKKTILATFLDSTNLIGREGEIGAVFAKTKIAIDGLKVDDIDTEQLQDWTKEFRGKNITVNGVNIFLNKTNQPTIKFSFDDKFTNEPYNQGHEILLEDVLKADGTIDSDRVEKQIKISIKNAIDYKRNLS